MLSAHISMSNRPNKRFKVIVYDSIRDKKKTLHFGLKSPKIGTYLEHMNDTLKTNYIKRHAPREDFDNYWMSGFWSRWLLWNKPTLEDSAEDIEDRYKIKITY